MSRWEVGMVQVSTSARVLRSAGRGAIGAVSYASRPGNLIHIDACGQSMSGGRQVRAGGSRPVVGECRREAQQ